MLNAPEQAIEHALKQMNMPEGSLLWLYGGAHLRHGGDVYNPLHSVTTGAEVSRFHDLAEIRNTYDVVLVCPPKQNLEALGLMAFALRHARKLVMVSAANDAGGGRLEKAMGAFGSSFDSLSKHKCRVVWTDVPATVDSLAVQEALLHLQPREVMIEGERWWSVPGVFSWDRADEGSKLLLQHLPTDIKGRVADFGCGYGYLTRHILQRYTAVSSIDCFDNDWRAVDCCSRNAGARAQTHWQDMKRFQAKPVYDAVIMNPPFHEGKKTDTDLGQTFILQALASLKIGGKLWMVANQYLPYEALLKEQKASPRVVFENHTYKIIEAMR